MGRARNGPLYAREPVKPYRPDLYYVVPAQFVQGRLSRDVRTARTLASDLALADEGSVWYVVQHVSSHSVHDVGSPRIPIKHVPSGNRNHGKRATLRKKAR